MALEGYFTGNIPDPYDERDVPLFAPSEVKQIVSQKAAVPPTAAPPSASAPAKPAAAPTTQQQPSAAPLQPVGPHLQAAAPASTSASTPLQPVGPHLQAAAPANTTAPAPTPAPRPNPVPPKPAGGASQPTPPVPTPQPVTGGGKPTPPVPTPQPATGGGKPTPPVPTPQPVTGGGKPTPTPGPVNPIPQPRPLPQPGTADPIGQPGQPVDDADSDADEPTFSEDPPWFDPDPVDRAGAVILPNLPPIYNQWKVGACSANASCAALRYAYCKFTGKSYDDFNPSRLYAWYYARISRAPLGYDDKGKDREGDPVTDIEARVKSDDGVFNRGSIHVFLTKGVCTEELWPYGRPHLSRDNTLSVKQKPNPCEPNDWDKVIWQAQPSAHQGDYKDITKTGLLPRAISYYRIYDSSLPMEADEKKRVADDAWRNTAHPQIELLERAIDEGFPFIFATVLFPGASLGALQVRNGVFIKPPPKIPPLRNSGHALLAVGYHRERRLFLVQNSWGTNWPTSPGDGEDMKGRFWMPYEWFTEKTGAARRWITYDFWVIKYSELSKAPPAAK